MLHIIKQRGHLALLLTFISLESFRHTGWMLFYEQFLSCTRQEINFGFIIYSGVITIAALLFPLLFKKTNINNIKKIRYPFIISLFVAFSLKALQLLMGMAGAYIMLGLWTGAVMIGICLCYNQIFKTVPKTLLGRFFGVAYFSDALIVSFIEQFTGTESYFYASIAVSFTLCIIAIIAYALHEKEQKQEVVEEHEWKPTKSFVGIALAILIVYVLIAGTMDNLCFFDDWIELPVVGLFTLPVMGIIYVVSGFLIDKTKPILLIPIALLLICVAQSMTYFATGDFFAYSYAIFSYFGSILLQLVVIIVPIFYARMKKNNYCISTLGEGSFYGGFCITSVFFMFTQQSDYRTIMGGILLSGIFCLLMVFYLIIMFERGKSKNALELQELELKNLRQQTMFMSTKSIESLPMYNEAFGLTKKEKEILPLIVSSLTAAEIAEQANLSVSTVKFHIKNILGKTNTKTRRELIKEINEYSK